MGLWYNVKLSWEGFLEEYAQASSMGYSDFNIISFYKFNLMGR